MPVRAFLLVCTLALSACDTLGFYTQAVRGQLGIISRREPIARLLEDPDTDPALKAKLEDIQAIRAFADEQLALPVNNNFSTYADLQRPFVVWNVFAAPEFSLESRNWCYPVAGCVTYRGYFSREAAVDYANKLEADGFDVYVGGVAAYSTLGWFADSVLNTVIERDRYRLAALIFHELAHQVVYVPGDTEFNESFATTVELEGLKRWLDANVSTAQARALTAKAALEKRYQGEFVALVKTYVPQFEAVYASGQPAAVMRAEKAGLVEAMRRDYRQLKATWQGYDAYDGWFAGEINNAKLNTVATYFNRVPDFERILAEEGNDLPAFYRRIAALGKLSKPQRDDALQGPATTAAL